MPLTDKEIFELEKLLEEDQRKKFFDSAKKDLLSFSKYMNPKYSFNGFIEKYHYVLDLFARGKIKKLIVTIPPQHTKSAGSTIALPSYLFGINPDLHIAIASYSATHAQKFNRTIQKVIDSRDYNNVFPKTTLSGSGFIQENAKNYIRTTNEFEIVNHIGSLKAVGRGGALTGSPVDIMILDDLYKDYEEANSPIIRQSVIDWYTTVVKTRLHNDSQELIVFTRWHEDDLIGWLEDKETVITIESYSDLDNIPKNAWVKINFEAIKDSPKTEFDPREKGEALFPIKHDAEKLRNDRALDVVKFDCLYQGNPVSKEGMLYQDFKTYNDLPPLKIIKNYTDTADTGSDFLCSINYALPLSENDKHIYILDWVYTDEPMEKTEPKTIKLLKNWRVSQADIESNNGGRGFGRAVEKEVNTVMNMFHQGGNKESRIISNSAKVNRDIVFPSDWAIRDSTFYNHLIRFKRKFKANKQDGIPDVLTGIIEMNENNLTESDIEVEND